MARFLPLALVLVTSLILTAVGGSPSSFALPMKGEIHPRGFYYVSMTIGDPPKTYILDVDTGSDLAWIQCDGPCVNCWKGPNALYKPSRNNFVPSKAPLCQWYRENHHSPEIKSPDKCDYRMVYADGTSSRGVFVSDSFHVPLTNRPVVQLTFGCGCDQRSPGKVPLPTETDGLLGLGRGKTSIISQLTDQGVTRNVFGHCLSRTGSGYLFFGDHASNNGAVTTWASMSPPWDSYSAGKASFVLGKKTLNIRISKPVVFDSGTPYTYFPSQTYREFLSALKDDLSKKPLNETVGDPAKLPVCWQGPFKSPLDVKKLFPSLFLKFGKEGNTVPTMEIPPENYLIISERKNACLGILDGTEEGLTDHNIIGAISMQDLQVIYDNENNKLGWTPADCSRHAVSE